MVYGTGISYVPHLVRRYCFDGSSLTGFAGEVERGDAVDLDEEDVFCVLDVLFAGAGV